MEFTFVTGQEVSWRKCLVTIVTRNGNSFQMGDVLSYNHQRALLATIFANPWRCPRGLPIFCLFANCNHLLTFLHHWLHLLLQCLHIGPRFIRDWSVTWRRIGIRFHIFSASGGFLYFGRCFSVFCLFFLLLDLTECLITTSEAGQFDFLSDSEERIEEVKNGTKVFCLKSSQVDQWMRMFALLENFLKKRTWCSQDDVVCLHLLTILT